MENKHCIFCTQLHNNHWVETETQEGNACDICYKIWQQNYALCDFCNEYVDIRINECNHPADEYGEAIKDEWACDKCASGWMRSEDYEDMD